MEEIFGVEKESKELRREFWIVLPFFLFALCIFLGSFWYKLAARTVPMLVGLGTTILSSMRLFHILFPKSKIGRFNEAGLSDQFDTLKEKIKSETIKEVRREQKREITFQGEKKALIALGICFVAFLLFGNLVGPFFAIVGTAYYYGFKKKTPLFVSLVSMYFIVYVILYKLMGAPSDYGLLLEPVLKSLGLI